MAIDRRAILRGFLEQLTRYEEHAQLVLRANRVHVLTIDQQIADSREQIELAQRDD